MFMRYISFISFLTFIDLFTKYLARCYLPYFHDGVTSKRILSLYVTMHEAPQHTIITTTIICSAILIMLWLTSLPRTVLCLWIAGSLGNLFELWYASAATDFIAIKVGNVYNITNIADFYILIGSLTLVFLTLSYKVRLIDFVPKFWRKYEDNT